MLKKTKRLSRQEFSNCFKAGQRYNSPPLQLIHCSKESFHGSVVVGKKVYKNAVSRNKLRRQIYALLYNWHKELNHSGVYILIAKPSIKNLSKLELKILVKELLGKVVKS